MPKITPARPRARDTPDPDSGFSAPGWCGPCYAAGQAVPAVLQPDGVTCAVHARVPLAGVAGLAATGAPDVEDTAGALGDPGPARPETERRTAPPAPVAARGECAGCGRGYGRRRSPSVQGQALWECAKLVVCDQCWHLAGGTAAITTRLAGETGEAGTAGGAMEPALVFDPAVEALLVAAAEYDELHPIDRLLVESGVRWAVLRHIAVPARMQLAGQVLRRPAPEATRSADSARVWLDAVEDRIRAQTATATAAGAGAGAGTFVYNAKRRRWWRIANLLACASDHNRRPLTWLTQEEIAAVVGCSTRTVRRAVTWLRAEGLLWEVVPGCRLPQQHVPDAETATEAAARRAALAAAVAAEDAAITRARTHLVLARAELDAINDGHTGANAAAAAQLALPDDVIAALAADVAADLATATDPALVNLSPVYELRTPTTPDPDLTPTRPAPTTNPLTSENTSHPDQTDEFVRPPQVCNQELLKSKYVQAVDRRRAPRGPYQEDVGRSERCTAAASPQDGADPVGNSSTPAAAGETSLSPQSHAVQAAQWLLRSRLDVRVCDEVSLRWLTAQIRTSHLLDHHSWTWEDLADLIHGHPEHTHLPRHITNPRGWIRARLTAATPTLPPSKLRVIRNIERDSTLFQQRRRAAADATAAAQRSDIAARRAAIDACPLCDELGWLHIAHDTPTSRCNHDPAAGGW